MTVEQTFDRSLQIADAHNQVRARLPTFMSLTELITTHALVWCYRHTCFILQSGSACRVPPMTSAHLPAAWLQRKVGTVQGTAKRLQGSGRKGNMQRASSIRTQPHSVRAQRRARGRHLDNQSRRQPHSWVRSSITHRTCSCRSSRPRQRSNDSTSSRCSSREAPIRNNSSGSWAALRSGQPCRVASLASSPVSSRRRPPQIGDHRLHACCQDAVLACCSVCCKTLDLADHFRGSACCRVLDTALHDLQALMAQAQAMVDLAEQFRLQLARQPAEPGSEEVWAPMHLQHSVRMLQAQAQAYASLLRMTFCPKLSYVPSMQTMATDLTDDLVSMGIATPVTKETAGRKYHKELARQVTSLSSALSMHATNADQTMTQHHLQPAMGCAAS